MRANSLLVALLFVGALVLAAPAATQADSEEARLFEARGAVQDIDLQQRTIHLREEVFHFDAELLEHAETVGVGTRVSLIYHLRSKQRWLDQIELLPPR